MPDVDEGLAALARHAARTGRLEPAAGVRRRADRRRRRRHAGALAAVVLAVVALGAGIAVAQPDRAGPAPLPPVNSPYPAPPAPPPSFGALGLIKNMVGVDSERAYALAPLTATPDQPGILLGTDGRFTVPASGRGTKVTVSDVGPDLRGSEQWIIRLDEKGGSRCLAAEADGAVGLARCGPADAGQRFELRQGPDDSYGIVSVASGRWLTWDLRPGSAPVLTGEPATGWNFIDVGPSTLAD
ncbi:hypothetical protein [Actinoplanes sp. M2I2]|uniref:hypothetical protein n=1 Tax=Actinoplanes sp. M2I2 TaxID=1734444 RepID=UPI002020C7FF|nr:hypothetical protein [Actinoplanes sp. M2I2]